MGHPEFWGVVLALCFIACEVVYVLAMCCRIRRRNP